MWIGVFICLWQSKMIKEIEFKIFKKNNGFKLSVNIVIYSLLFIGIAFAYLAN